MPPNVWGRDRFTSAVVDETGKLYLTEREPYGFRNIADNVTHVADEGDTLWTLAARYYQSFERPAGFWWAIADFQPEPIHVPTVALEPGRQVIIPSERTLLEEILSEKRRKEHQA